MKNRTVHLTNRRGFIVHYTPWLVIPAHFAEHIQLVLIVGFKSLPGLLGSKGLLLPTIFRGNPSLSNSQLQLSHTQLRVGLKRRMINTANRFIVLDLTELRRAMIATIHVRHFQYTPHVGIFALWLAYHYVVCMNWLRVHYKQMNAMYTINQIVSTLLS